MNMKFTGKKNSAYLLELFKYYALSHPNYCYPFGKHSMCFIMPRTYTDKAILEHNIQLAYFLSLVHYHVLPYWFLYEHRIGLLAEGHLIHKVEANFVIEDLIGVYK